MAARNIAVDVDAIEADIAARDARDQGRTNAPLIQAADADLLDTSQLSIEEAVRKAIALVDAQMERHRKR